MSTVYEEFKKIVDHVPDVTFNSEMTIDIGNREVQLKFLGRGNTAGDAVVYLPKEKILITGDLLDHPVPYLGGGFPNEMFNTLKKMDQLDVVTFIPGHGDIVSGKDYLHMTIDFIGVVTEQVSKEVFRLGNDSRKLDVVQEAVSKAINLESWTKKFAGDDADDRSFFEGFSYPGLVKAAYVETWRR